MKHHSFIRGIFSSLYLSLKFGLVGSLIGLILHIIWGNLDTIIYTLVSGFLIGFFIGLCEFLFSNPRVNTYPYLIILFIRSLFYFLIALVGVYSVFRVYLYHAGYARGVLSDPATYADIEKVYYLANINTIYILLFTISATFVWQLKSFFVKGVLFNYLTGRYHKPTIGNRIFMFLDLNDATTIAEKLGSKKYSLFLSNFFKDVDQAFTKTNGKIFQYVGDEVVVIWNPKSGLKNNNCVWSYFIAKQIIDDKKNYYMDKYDVVPSFKASLHFGEVTITEIGVSKKEIVYHGDTMNTAARICSSAHSLNKKLLISDSLYDKLHKSSNFIAEDLGEHLLKGKDEKIKLYSVSQ